MRIYILTGSGLYPEDGNSVTFVGTDLEKAKQALVQAITPDIDGHYRYKFWDLVAYEDNSSQYDRLDNYMTKNGEAPRKGSVLEVYDHDPFNKK